MANNTANFVCPLAPPLRVLTEDDALMSLRDLLQHGWGELRVVIQDGYIATLHTSATQRGRKPVDR